jgi:hypothetical protein
VNIPKIVLAALLVSVVAVPAIAGPVKVPSAKPVVVLNIPDSWSPEETDRGVGCESPDKVATVFFEIAESEKDVNALLDETVDWLVKDNGVKVNGGSKVEKDIAVGGIASKLLAFDADSKEWGPAKVGFIFTPIAGKLLVTTFWFDAKDNDKAIATINQILASVKPAK